MYETAAGPRDHEDNHAYGAVETNTETDQTADTDASESNLPANRRRRSRRRRTDEDATLMDGMSESDNASLSENGTGMEVSFIWIRQFTGLLHAITILKEGIQVKHCCQDTLVTKQLSQHIFIRKSTIHFFE